MPRKTINNAVAGAAAAAGYCFHSGFDYRMGEVIIAYPALWMTPPKIVSVQGRNEGAVRYRVVLQLMKLCDKTTRHEKEAAWCALEQDALEIYRALAGHDRLAAVTVAECSPGEFSLTNHGELSVCLKLDIDTPFCKL